MPNVYTCMYVHKMYNFLKDANAELEMQNPHSQIFRISQPAHLYSLCDNSAHTGLVGC